MGLDGHLKKRHILAFFLCIKDWLWLKFFKLACSAIAVRKCRRTNTRTRAHTRAQGRREMANAQEASAPHELMNKRMHAHASTQTRRGRGTCVSMWPMFNSVFNISVGVHRVWLSGGHWEFLVHGTASVPWLIHRADTQGKLCCLQLPLCSLPPGLSESRRIARQSLAIRDSVKMSASAIRWFGDSVIPRIRGCQPDRAEPGWAQRRSYAAQATQATHLGATSRSNKNRSNKFLSGLICIVKEFPRKLSRWGTRNL